MRFARAPRNPLMGLPGFLSWGYEGSKMKLRTLLVLLLPIHCVVQVKGLHLWGNLDSYGVNEVKTTGLDEADKTSENVGADAENTTNESGGMFDKMFDKIGSTLWEYLNRAIANLDLELHQVNLVC